jgi:hypothetical protein
VQSLTYTKDVRVQQYDTATGIRIDTSTRSEQRADPMTLGQLSVAIVRDTSFYGATGPVYGSRSRFELGRSQGTIDLHHRAGRLAAIHHAGTPDHSRHSGLALRRYGPGSEDERLIQLYAGHPEFVHGYGVGTSNPSECVAARRADSAASSGTSSAAGCSSPTLRSVRRCQGVLHGELGYGRVPVDLVGFYDAGVAWTSTTRPAFAGGAREVIAVSAARCE